MPLSHKAQRSLQIACGQDLGAEIAAAVASGGAPADNVAAFGSTSNTTTPAVAAYSAGTNLTGVDGTGENAAPLVGTETRLDALDTKVAALVTAVNTCAIQTGVEARLDNIEAKVDALLGKLIDAGLMAAP